MTTETRFRLNTILNADGSVKHGIRCDWPVLFKGEQYKGEGKYRCGAKLLISPAHPQFTQVEAAINEAAALKWKDKAAATLKIAKAKDNLFLRDGDLKAAKSDGYAGMFEISANCPGGDTEAECEKPKVFDAGRAQVMAEAANPIYRGCYVNAVIEIYADSRFGDGVFCKLVGIQFAKDGDAFGSAPAKADDFEDMTEGAGAELF